MDATARPRVSPYHCNGFTPTPPGELAPVHGSPAFHPALRSISSSACVPFLSVRSIRSTSHTGRAPERQRARDRHRFRQPGVATFRRRPCRPRRYPAPQLPQERAGHAARDGRTTPVTADFWNARHICTTAGSNDRAGVGARAGPPGIALSVPVSLTPVKNSHDGPGSVPASAQRNPTPKRRPASVGFPGGRVSRPRKQDTALSGLSRGTVAGELVEVVGGAALAPAAAANFRVLMTPGGHMDPNALRPLRALLRPLTAMARSGVAVIRL